MIDYEDEIEPIYIVTSPEAPFAPNVANWFYQFVGEGSLDGLKDSGYIELCGCPECESLGEDVGEFFAIYQALKLASEVEPNGAFELCFGSFNFEAYIGKNGTLPDESVCRSLRDLVVGVKNLLKLLNVELTHYTYGNKDCIPIF